MSSGAKHIGKAEHEAMFNMYAQCRSIRQVAAEFNRSYNAVWRASQGGPFVNGKPTNKTWTDRLPELDAKAEKATDREIVVALSQLREWIDMAITRVAEHVTTGEIEATVADLARLIDIKLKLEGIGKPAEEQKPGNVIYQFFESVKESDPEAYDAAVSNAKRVTDRLGPKRLGDLV